MDLTIDLDGKERKWDALILLDQHQWEGQAPEQKKAKIQCADLIRPETSDPHGKRQSPETSLSKPNIFGGRNDGEFRHNEHRQDWR